MVLEASGQAADPAYWRNLARALIEAAATADPEIQETLRWLADEYMDFACLIEAKRVCVAEDLTRRRAAPA